jgi:predicted dehydrogenase
MKINLVLWGLGRHSINKILPAITKSRQINLYGLFTRNQKLLSKYSKKLSCKIWKNEKTLLSDNKIDVVYLATPIGLHYMQGKKILKSKKHLWSEKSLANNYQEVSDLVKIAKKNKLSICESFMYLHHPIFKKIKNLIDKRYIGDPTSVSLTFNCPHLEKSNWRYKKKLGGGSLLDLGCYPISSFLNLFKYNSKLYYSDLKRNKSLGVDISGSALFINKYALFNLNWGFGKLYKNSLRIIGTKGTIIAEPFFSKPNSITPKIIIYKNKSFKKISFPKTNHFIKMLDNFSHIIKDKRKINNHLQKCLVQSKIMNEIRLKKND